MFIKMEGSIKDPARIALFEKIKEFEKNGWFDKDVEEDPPFEPINPDNIDWQKKKLFSKMMTFFATNAARKYFENMRKRKEVIFAGVNGFENLEGFNEGAIITCNHFHHFDNYAILLAFEKYYKRLKLFRVVKDGNFAFKGTIGMIMRHCNTLPVNQDGRSPRTTFKCINTIKELVKNERNKVLIYPEQAMWWNYRKPRPLKDGAFMIAAAAKSHIIPCFITLKDSEILGSDGFPVQEFTVNVLPVIKFNPNESIKENASRMMMQNYEAWKNTYEKTYNEKLTYE